MKDLIFHNNGHPVRKEDFIYLKDRSDKTLIAVCKAAWPSYNTILLDVQVESIITEGLSYETADYNVSSGTIYHNGQLYTVKEKRLLSINISYGGLCFMFPKNDVYDEEDSVQYEDEEFHPVHVNRVAVASYILSDGTGKPAGWDDTIYESFVLWGDTKSLGFSESDYDNSEDIKDHKDDEDNPHKVTKEQVELGNVPNSISDDITSNSSETLATTALTSSLIAEVVNYVKRGGSRKAGAVNDVDRDSNIVNVTTDYHVVRSSIVSLKLKLEAAAAVANPQAYNIIGYTNLIPQHTFRGTAFKNVNNIQETCPFIIYGQNESDENLRGRITTSPYYSGIWIIDTTYFIALEAIDEFDDWNGSLPL